MGWVGLGHTKWTHGQLCVGPSYNATSKRQLKCHLFQSAFTVQSSSRASSDSVLRFASRLFALYKLVDVGLCSLYARRYTFYAHLTYYLLQLGSHEGWLCSRVVSVLDSGAVGPGFKSQPQRQTVHTHRASVHQAAILVAALLRVAGVTAGLAESNGSLPRGD